MADRIYSYDYGRLKACQKEVRILLSSVPDVVRVDIDDADDLLVYQRISDMTHRGMTLKAIAKEFHVSTATIHKRRKHGAIMMRHIIVPLVELYNGNMTKVAKSLVPIFTISDEECDRFVKNFIVDYPYDTGEGPIAALINITK